jgi:transposase InsO family protein
MVSPRNRRRAVDHLRTKHYSQRRACRLVDQPRSTQRYCPKAPTQKARRLRKRILQLARKFPRYGHRRLTAELRRGGASVNRKFVRRVCREEGIKIVVKSRKRRRNGGSGEQRQVAERKNQVWSYDFVFDQLDDGRQIKILPVVDNFTRECLAIIVAFSITSTDVIAVLEKLVAEHGAPSFLRSDNGPEFIANAVKAWLAASGIGTDYIEPGSPWENAYSESFNSRFRDELLDRELFSSLLEARVLIEEHRTHYNHGRVHSSLGYLTLVEFAAGVPPVFVPGDMRVGLMMGA